MPTGSAGRRSAQTAMFHIAEAFVRWIAPILSFTADEIWRYLPGAREDNVLFATAYAGLAPIPPARAAEAAALGKLLVVRETVNRVLEPMRADGRIGASLQAEVEVSGGDALAAFAGTELGREARFLFITSAATFAPEPANADDAVKVEGMDAWVRATPTTHAKCVRCWHFRADVGTVGDHPELCVRCAGNVDGPGEDRRYF
jgi:isoleucyl-tRNA synthetase